MATIPFIQGQSRKLAKLTIISLPSSNKTLDLSSLAAVAAASPAATVLGQLNGAIPLVFQAMYNPTSFSQAYGSEYVDLKTSNPDDKFVQLKRVTNSTVTFKLLIDGTGASPASSLLGINLTSLIASATKGVDLVVQYLLQAVLGLNKITHEANNLKLVWGIYFFEGRAKSVNVNYTMFDRIGRPIRAEVDVTFIQRSDVKSIFSIFKQSPDITKTYIVKAGDTLPLIALREYEDESFYLELAKVNKLKNYRKLEPGMTLVMPPFNKNTEETTA